MKKWGFEMLNYEKKYLVAAGLVLVAIIAGFIAVIIGGCSKNAVPAGQVECTAKACPVGVEPIVPDGIPFCLLPGQTAQVLEDIVVEARIPYQGDKVYEGPVRIEAGSMLVKPKEE